LAEKRILNPAFAAGIAVWLCACAFFGLAWRILHR
jgi:hypothetical protein